MENFKYAHRITPSQIIFPEKDEIVVFGSNLQGRHGAGLARQATMWGAKHGHPTGLQGNTYAIPTKDKDIKHTLTPKEIKPYVDEFISFAVANPAKIFLVTKIGTGLATNTVEQMAPLFKEAVEIENIHLPRSFWGVLIK